MKLPIPLSALATACLAFLAISCGPVYHNPPKDPATTATLRCTKEKPGFYSHKSYWVKSIDGKNVIYATSWSSADKEIVVVAGRRELVLSGHFDLGLHQPAGHVEPTAVSADLKAAGSYLVRGFFDHAKDRKMHLWIGDTATGKPASERLKLPCRYLVPRPMPVMLPVG